MPTLSATAGALPGTTLPPGWHGLDDATQLDLTRAALMQAAGTIAEQAETLAAAFDDGGLADRGGADALRLFARVLRALHTETAMGHA
jgi:hypothetical protein